MKDKVKLLAAILLFLLALLLFCTTAGNLMDDQITPTPIPAPPQPANSVIC